MEEKKLRKMSIDTENFLHADEQITTRLHNHSVRHNSARYELGLRRAESIQSWENNIDKCRDYLRSQQNLRIEKYFKSEKKAEKDLKKSRLVLEEKAKAYADSEKKRFERHSQGFSAAKSERREWEMKNINL